MLDFELDMQELTNIKVIGCGGGGGNAVNRMILEGLKNVEFIVYKKAFGYCSLTTAKSLMAE